MRSVHTALMCRPVVQETLGARAAVSVVAVGAPRQAMLCVWLASPLA